MERERERMNPSEQDNEQQQEIIALAKRLFRNAMKNKWKEVIEIYRKRPEAHMAKITRLGDTALHIAVSDDQESTVEELIEIVDKKMPHGALRMQNDAGNTPLHLAAYLGNENMCYYIASQDPTLMGIRNQDKETPLCLAVLHGRTEAYLRLTSLCKHSPDRYKYCRGKGGDTILHSAIDGEFFDMAFHIIEHYEDLVDSVNEEGSSPLHTLATKPSAFRSGSHIRGFVHRLIYHCIFVDEINLDTTDVAKDLEYDHKNSKYPENYQTCVGLFRFTRKLVRILMACATPKTGANTKQESEKRNNKEQGQQPEGPEVQQQCDEETPKVPQLPEEESEKMKAAGITKPVPENWITCFNIVKFFSKAMFVILGLGTSHVEMIREEKKKHVWSIQVMRKLSKHASSHEYEYNGKKPCPSSAVGKTPSFDFSFSLDHKDDEDQTEDSSQNSNENGKKENKEDILELIPVKNDKKNQIYKLLKGQNITSNAIFSNEYDTCVWVCSRKKGEAPEMENKETPLLIAAKNGIKEMVVEILEQFPVAINDTNADKKNIVLLAVENRQPRVYQFLRDRTIMKETIFRKTDKDGNSALHLAAMMGDHRPWLIPGAALQMQWEIKWYQYVKKSMPTNYFIHHNKDGKTPLDIFNDDHKTLVDDAGKWLKETSQSCSVVAALIATVAFATSATVPGGVNQEKGTPTLQREAAFGLFALSSLVALCFSVTSVVMFLAILTSRYQDKDFGKGLPNMLLYGLTSLFVSIGSMLISFCAGHFFVLKQNLKYVGILMYAITCLPVTFFAFAQFGLYIDLVKATIRSVPQRSVR